MSTSMIGTETALARARVFDPAVCGTGLFPARLGDSGQPSGKVRENLPQHTHATEYLGKVFPR